MKVLEVLQGSAERLSRLKHTKRREAVLLDLLTSYFIMLDIAACGAELLALGGNNAVERVSSLSEVSVRVWMHRCNALLWRQRNNLGRLSEILLYKGLPVLDVLDARLLRKLATAIGTKERGLFSVGASVEIYFYFGALPDAKELDVYGEEVAKARYAAGLVESVLSSDGARSGKESALRGLNELKDLTESLRTHVVDLCSSDELIELSARAKLRANSETVLRRSEDLGPMIGR